MAKMIMYGKLKLPRNLLGGIKVPPPKCFKKSWDCVCTGCHTIWAPMHLSGEIPCPHYESRIEAVRQRRALMRERRKGRRR